MPYPGLLHPEPLPLQQSTGDCPSSGDTQKQFCLSLCGVSGSWCAQGLFEPSEHLWLVWDLILITDHHSKYNHHEKVQDIDTARITKMSTK